MGALVGKLVNREIHQGQWSLYENGKSEPPLDIIRATAQVSGLAPEYLAFGVGATNALVNRATGDSRPTYKRVAEELGGEVAYGTPERPDPAPEKKQAASEDRPRKRRRR